eukprot:4934189-Ditylum_brightwellii.AAC.1
MNEVELFQKVKINLTKCPTTKHFKTSSDIFGHGVNTQCSKVNGISYISYCCKKKNTAASLEKDCDLTISRYVSSSVSAFEHVIPKAVSETTISLKVVQERDAKMHNLLKK